MDNKIHLYLAEILKPEVMINLTFSKFTGKNSIKCPKPKQCIFFSISTVTKQHLHCKGYWYFMTCSMERAKTDSS